MLFHLTYSPKFLQQNALSYQKCVSLPPMRVSMSGQCTLVGRNMRLQYQTCSRQYSSPASTPKYGETKRTKRKIVLWVGYLGTGYKGLQKNRSVPTLEGELENALYKAGLISPQNYGTLRKIRWSRSSRTDKGVHALKAIISMKLLYNWRRVKVSSGWRYDITEQCHELPPLINRHLPPHFRVFSAAPVPRSFCARSRCTRRVYEYWLPRFLLAGTSFETRPNELQQLCREFVGVHNWHNFTSTRAHLEIFKDATHTLSEDLRLYQPHASRQSSNNAPSNALKRTNDRGRDNREEKYDENEDEEDDEFDDEEAEDEEFDEECPESVRARELKVEEKWLNPLYYRPREEQWKLWTPFPSLFRKMESVTFAEAQIEGIPFVKFTLVSQSFLMHQIRAILGWILLTLKGVVPLDFTKIALNGPFIFRMPLVPSSGLILKDATFLVAHDTQDLFQLTPQEQQQMNEFRDKVLYPHIAAAQTQNKEFELLLAQLSTFKIPDEDNIRRLYDQYMAEMHIKQKPRKMRQCAVEIVQAILEKMR
jgi:tRNA pseudouridine38-40 synthase